MYQPLQNDLEELNVLLSAVKERSLSYLQQLHEQPNSHYLKDISNNALPEEGIGLDAALAYFDQQHAHKIVASSGPRYWGFVTGGTTPAAIAGDWLTSVFDQNPQGIKGPGDVSGSIELETIELLLRLFELPDHFNGGFVSGATMANFTGLAVARQWAGMKNNNDIAREGIKTGIRILSAVPHSSVIKVLSLLGLGSNNLVPVNTIAGNREAMDIKDLEIKLQESGDAPVIVISSGGTVNSVDFDDMNAIAELQKVYGFFWHIDAAFGGFAACSPLHKYLLKGWEAADSIAVDCHKWMNVPYDSAVYFIKKTHARLQMQTFQNTNAPYLGDPEASFTYLNFGPENSRRFRALPAWFSLMAYGKKGFEWMVENSIRLARELGERIEAETAFTCIAPVRLNVVCFRPKNEDLLLNDILSTLNSSGKIFLTPSVYKGTPCLRAALVNWRTTEADISIAIHELKQFAG
jgi:glutamate/tyrosine decarboxylase-like PLP-dependent enzyme